MVRRRLGKATDDRPDGSSEVCPAHRDGIGVGPGAKDDFGFGRQPHVGEYQLAEQLSKRRDRTGLATREQLAQFLLSSETMSLPPASSSKRSKSTINGPEGAPDRLSIDEEDDHLGPIAAWNVCRRRLFLRAKSGSVRNDPIGHLRGAQEFMDERDA
jgi:hypothetical protein